MYSVINFITNLPNLIGPVFLWEAGILWLLIANTINIAIYPWFRKNHDGLLKFEKSFSILLGNLALTTGFIGTLLALINGFTNATPGDSSSISVVFSAIGHSIWSTIGGSMIASFGLISAFLGEQKEANYKLRKNRGCL